jgi:hypothetical protein
MTLESIVAYGLACVLLMVVLLWLLLRSKVSVRVGGDVTGVLITGPSSGTIIQNKTEAASPSGAEDRRAAKVDRAKVDRVAWVIGVASVIAAAQFAFDVLKKK